MESGPWKPRFQGQGRIFVPIRSMGRLLGDFRIQARVSQSRYGPGLDSTFCAIPFLTLLFRFRDRTRIVHAHCSRVMARITKAVHEVLTACRVSAYSFQKRKCL